MKDTQNKLILDHLRQGNSLTGIEALNRFGCFRLASRISDLKKAGAPIVKDTIKENGKRYAKYYLYAK